MTQNRSLRVGLTAILLSLCLRLSGSGLPERLLDWLTRSETAAILISIETGREVRFSPYLEAFSPDFVESPPASLEFLPEMPLPCFSEDQVSLFWATAKKPDIPALLRQKLSWDLRAAVPTVLILHTHSTESYTRHGEDYVESAAWRTLDENYNMLSIGAIVKDRLEAAGIGVIQDREIHDYPSYNGSYVDARQTMEQILADNPGIQLVLDLHRDAAGTGGHQMRTLATVDGQESAQLMVVMGTNHDAYEHNLSLGLKLHAQLERQHPGITRPLQLRGARYNQDLCPGALLVEVGAAGNSHQEAVIAANALADAIIALARGTG